MNDQNTNSRAAVIQEIEAIRKIIAPKLAPGKADQLCDRALLDPTTYPIEQLRQDLFNSMEVKPVSKPMDLEGQGVNLKKYSLSRAYMSAIENGGKVQGYERDVASEIARQSKKDATGFWVPSPEMLMGRADNIATTATLGGFNVATQLLPSEYVEILRNKAFVIQAGARVLNGLIGNVTISKQNSAGTVNFLASETANSTQSTPDFLQMTLSPRPVAGFNVYSKQLLVQSTPSIDALLQDDLRKVIAIAIDKSVLHTVTNGPTPISLTTGIATVTNSAAGAIPTFAKIIAMESAVAAANADVGSMAYITNSLVKGALKSAVKSTVQGASGFIWETGMDSNDRMNGYRAYATQNVLSAQTVGTLTTCCSSIFFGNWQDLLIGTWGGVDVLIDPYTAAISREVKIYQSALIDAGVRHAASFAIMNDALTS